MFDVYQKPAGRAYTTTVAWLAVAVIFIPAALIAIQPSYVFVSLALVGAVACLVMSWVSWKRA